MTKHIGTSDRWDVDPQGKTDSRNILLTFLFILLAFHHVDAHHLSPQIHMPLDATTKQPKGLAYVSFVQPANALQAYEALDRKSFQGRLLHILAAVDRKGKVEVEDGDGRKKTLKEEKNQKRKANAGKEFNWSMLYMNVRVHVTNIALLNLTPLCVL